MVNHLEHPLPSPSEQDAVFTMVLDGYNAPLTAGNFFDLVSKGFYDGIEIQRSDGVLACARHTRRSTLALTGIHIFGHNPDTLSKLLRRIILDTRPVGPQTAVTLSRQYTSH